MSQWGPRGWALAWLAVGLLGAAAWFHPSVSASDLWWHLASGREIAGARAVPSVDSFSFTFQGKPWTNHEWLWDLVFWIGYSASPDAAGWINLAILAATFAVLYLVLLQASGSPPASALALAIAAATSHWFLDIRPHVVSLLLTAIVLATRGHPWRLWLWPPLMVLWANTHAGFVFGLGLVVLLAATRTTRWLLLRARDRPMPARAGSPKGRSGPDEGAPAPWKDLLLAAACAAAAVLNPSGPGIVRYPLAYLDRTTPFRSLIEWTPPALGFDPGTFNGRFHDMAILSAAGLAVVLLDLRRAAVRTRETMRRRARRDAPGGDAPGGDAPGRDAPGRTPAHIPPAGRRDPLYLVLLACTTLAMALTARRFIPLFALTSAPLVAIAIARAGEWALGRLAPLVSGGERASRALPFSAAPHSSAESPARSAARSAGRTASRTGPAALPDRNPGPAATRLRPLLGLAALGLGAALALVSWKDVTISPGLLYRWTQGYVNPQAAVRYLAAVPAAARPFNSYNYGGYILLFAPGRQVFIDSRANTLYDEAIFRDYGQIYQARPGFAALLDRYGVDSAIVDRDAPLRRALLSLEAPWMEIYSDRLAAILLSPERAAEVARTGPLPDPERLLAGDAEALYVKAQQALGAGDLEAAARRVEEAVRANPLLVPAYGMLAYIRAKQRDAPGLERAIRAGIAAEPRWKGQLHQLAGQAYEALGDRGKAIEAYERGTLVGPFDSPGAQSGRIRRLRNGP